MAVNVNNSTSVRNLDLVTFCVRVYSNPSIRIHFRKRKWDTKVVEMLNKCKYTTADEVAGFNNRYLSINDETLKISTNKECGEKSLYSLN